MSDLTDQITREHRVVYPVGNLYGCRCGLVYGLGGLDGKITHHLMEMTEAAVRARIAADIEAVRAEEEEAFASSGLKGELAERWEGMQDAARIAEGGTS